MPARSHLRGSWQAMLASDGLLGLSAFLSAFVGLVVTTFDKLPKAFEPLNGHHYDAIYLSINYGLSEPGCKNV